MAKMIDSWDWNLQRLDPWGQLAGEDLEQSQMEKRTVP